MKKILLTTAGATIFGLASLSAPFTVIYDGGAITTDPSQTFSVTLAVDATEGNDAPSMDFAATAFGTALFAASYGLTPNQVDFSGPSVVSFDYKLAAGSITKLSDVRLKIADPVTGVKTTALDALGANGTNLIGDGAWHTVSFTASEGSAFAWTSKVQGWFNTNAIDPTAPQEFWIQISAETGFAANIDNVKVSVVGDVPSETFWADSPADESGWRYSGTGYDEPGIGWIWDGYWPWVYTTGIKGVGQWINVYDLSAERNGFYAYVIDGSYWIYGVSAWGYYYSLESGNEGWVAFAL